MALELDLSRLAKRLRGTKATKAAGAIVNAAGAAQDAVDRAHDAMASPFATGKARGCTTPCTGQVIALADLRRREQNNSSRGYSVTLIVARVQWSDGVVDVCVRQNIPSHFRGTIAIGTTLPLLADPTARSLAVVDWVTAAKQHGVEPDTEFTADQFDWPDVSEWPTLGHIEVRDKHRYTSRVEERRAAWSATWATLVSNAPGHSITDDREERQLQLQLPERLVAITERTPDLAIARMKVNLAMPIAVLVSPTGDVCVDWEATLNRVG